jgi:hypothetical protein
MFGLILVGICAYALGALTIIGIIVQRNVRGDHVSHLPEHGVASKAQEAYQIESRRATPEADRLASLTDAELIQEAFDNERGHDGTI